MTHADRVTAYLEDILQAIDRATGYVQDVTDFSAFEQDYRTQDAVLRNIMVIGEAVAKIHSASPEFVAANPDVPWANIRAMRNLVIHQYAHVDLKIVWQTIRIDMPNVRQQVAALLAHYRPTTE